MQQQILIIDDDRDLCALLKNQLEAEHFTVTLQHDGIKGLEAAITGNYQLTVLDIMLPELNGFEVLTALRQTVATPVLMLTARGDEADKISGLRLGADDYLTKPFSLREFVARVQALIRRNTVFSHNTTAEKTTLVFDGLSIDPARRAVQCGNFSPELTAKEFDLLYFLATSPARVYTKKQIYNAVWQDEYGYDDNNVMVLIRRLRMKIEAHPDQPRYILTVRGIGYKFGGQSC